MELLIDKGYVSSKLQIAKGYLDKDFNRVFIREAQELDLKPLLCEAFYFDLVAGRGQKPYQKLIQGGEYSYQGRTYAFEGIGTVLAYFAYARFVLKSNVVSASHGLSIKNTSFSEPLPLEERRNFYYESRKDANTFFEQVELYLERHPQDYRSWKCSGNCSTREVKVSKFGIIP